jgi:hypothetical protein
VAAMSWLSVSRTGLPGIGVLNGLVTANTRPGAGAGTTVVLGVPWASVVLDVPWASVVLVDGGTDVEPIKGAIAPPAFGSGELVATWLPVDTAGTPKDSVALMATIDTRMVAAPNIAPTKRIRWRRLAARHPRLDPLRLDDQYRFTKTSNHVRQVRHIGWLRSLMARHKSTVYPPNGRTN